MSEPTEHPTTGGSYAIENGRLVLVDLPTKPNPGKSVAKPEADVSPAPRAEKPPRTTSKE